MSAISFRDRSRRLRFAAILGLCIGGTCYGLISARAQTTTSDYVVNNGSAINIPNPTSYITPDSNGVSETLNVTAAGVITNFNYITITSLNHTYMGDLTATLTHGGLTVDLFDHLGGTSTNYNSDPGDGFILSSSSTYSFAYAGSSYSAYGYTPGGGWSTVSTGTYQAQGNVTGGADSANAANTLAMLTGQAVAGPWVLTIYDNAPLDSGSFTGFDLNITSINSSAMPEPETLPYVAVGFGLLIAGPSLRLMKHSRLTAGTRA